jgi:DNA-binding transcriptional MerR regulator
MITGSSMSMPALEYTLPHDTFPDGMSSDGLLRQPGYIGIGEMAKRHSTTLRTLRFYEAKGLLKPRRSGQNRFYDNSAQHRFKLIDEGRKLGFTLTEIAELIGPSQSVRELNLSMEKIADQILHLEEQHRQVTVALSALRRRYYLMRENNELPAQSNSCGASSSAAGHIQTSGSAR